jgi:hypothetical protein
MQLNQAYRFFWSLANHLHRSQAKTLIAISSCLTLAGRLRSFDIAQTLARRTGVQNKSALQRFYRFIHNRRLDDLKVWVKLAASLLPAAGPLPTISIDWTEWRFDLHVLTAAVSIDRRAIPIFAQTFPKHDIPRSQNTRENTFVRLLTSLFPPLLQIHPAV